MPTDYLLSPYFPGMRLPHAKNFETNRLLSFKNWKNEHVFISPMAKAGFVHTGYEDEVECCFCNFKHCNWKKGDIPLEVHRQCSPACYLFTERMSMNSIGPNIHVPSCQKNNNPSSELKSFLQQKGASCVGVRDTGVGTNKDENVNPPVQFPGVNMRFQNRARAVSIISIPETADGNHAYTAKYVADAADVVELYPQFASQLKRQDTYTRFPLGHLTASLCKQGFFYTGHHDIVICFSCGLGLYKWEPGDDPKIGHARWRPSCSHLCAVVSPGFIRTVRREMENVGAAQ